MGVRENTWSVGPGHNSQPDPAQFPERTCKRRYRTACKARYLPPVQLPWLEQWLQSQHIPREMGLLSPGKTPETCRPGLVSYFIFTKYRHFEAAQRRQNQRILSDLIKGNGVGREDFIQFTKFQVPHCMPQSLS